MNREAIIKPWSGIKFTGLKKMKLTPSCVHSFTHSFQGVLWLLGNLECLCSHQMNVFFKATTMGKKESKDNVEPQKIWDNETQLCVLVCVCVCVHAHTTWGREKALGNNFEKYFNFWKQHLMLQFKAMHCMQHLSNSSQRIRDM